MAFPKNDDSPGLGRNGVHGAWGTPVGREFTECVEVVLERLLAKLRGGIYSPRIKLLSIDQLCEALNLSKSTIYHMIEEGKFPKPQRNLGKNLWRECALIAWLDANDPNQSK